MVILLSEVNLKKLYSIEGIKSPTCHKEVQSMNGTLVVLSRFLSKFGENLLSFLQELLRVNTKFKWTCECEEALQHLKMLPPIAKPTKSNTFL